MKCLLCDNTARYATKVGLLCSLCSMREHPEARRMTELTQEEIVDVLPSDELDRLIAAEAADALQLQDPSERAEAMRRLLAWEDFL